MQIAVVLTRHIQPSSGDGRFWVRTPAHNVPSVKLITRNAMWNRNEHCIVCDNNFLSASFIESACTCNQTPVNTGATFTFTRSSHDVLPVLASRIRADWTQPTKTKILETVRLTSYQNIELKLANGCRLNIEEYHDRGNECWIMAVSRYQICSIYLHT